MSRGRAAVGYTSSTHAQQTRKTVAGHQPIPRGGSCRVLSGSRARRAIVTHGLTACHALPSRADTGTSPAHHTTKIVSGAMFEFRRVEPNAAAARTNRNAASTATRAVHRDRKSVV